VVLYAVWVLPQIAAWRNVSLVVGAVAGVYISWYYRADLVTKRALPIWFVGLLFVWATIHLFFLSQDPNLQWTEYRGIWKRAGLAGLFALGFGLSIANTPRKWVWPLIFLALLIPSLTYLLKWILTFYGQGLGFDVPAYLKVYYGSSRFYVPKTDYVVFCLPTLAVGLGGLQYLIVTKKLTVFKLISCLLLVLLPLFVFYGQNIKNGIVYAALLFLTLFLILLKYFLRRKIWLGLFSLLMVATLSAVFAFYYIEKNPSLSSLYYDIKTSIKIDEYPQWRYSTGPNLPINELGRQVSVSNYVRIAWAVVGLKLIAENPMGYGLIENSFSRLVEIKWPDGKNLYLSHSHSGWIDLILGIGIPGILLIIIAMILTLRNIRFLGLGERYFCSWLLSSIILLWCTTEVSANGNFDPLIFWIVFAGGLSLRNQKIT